MKHFEGRVRNNEIQLKEKCFIVLSKIENNVACELHEDIIKLRKGGKNFIDKIRELNKICKRKTYVIKG